MRENIGWNENRLTGRDLFLLVSLSAVLCIVYALFLASFSYFPVYYHPDEYTKLGQILTNKRNYHHPQLLLEINTHLRLWLGLHELTSVAIMARLVSNITAAIACFFFAMTAMTVFRKPAPVLMVLIICFTSTSLFVPALYIKEDIFLIASLAISMFFAANVLRKPNSIFFQIGLGLACALLASSKYSSAILAMTLIWLVFHFVFTDRKIKISAYKQTIFSFFISIIIINIRMILNIKKATSGAMKEINHVATDHIGISHPVYSLIYPSIMLENLGTIGMSIIILCIGIAVFNLKNRRNWQDMFIISAVVVTIFYFLILQMTPIKSEMRYIQPVMLSLSFISVLVIYGIQERYNQVLARFAAAALFLLLLGSQSGAMLAVVDGARLETFIKTQQWLQRQDLAKKNILIEGYAGAFLIDLEDKRSYTAKLGAGTVKEVGEIGHHCQETDCGQYDLIIIACNNFEKYYEKFSNMTDRAVKAKAIYEKLFAGPEPLFEIGDRDNNPHGKYGLYQGTCIYVYPSDAFRR